MPKAYTALQLEAHQKVRSGRQFLKTSRPVRGMGKRELVLLEDMWTASVVIIRYIPLKSPVKYVKNKDLKHYISFIHDLEHHY